ncbi:MAG: energy transducer TonB, partial [Acetobacteraceae bacterium]|nr:energy transducer TonB [Acetobacteraceae bacterium]
HGAFAIFLIPQFLKSPGVDMHAISIIWQSSLEESPLETALPHSHSSAKKEHKNSSKSVKEEARTLNVSVAPSPKIKTAHFKIADAPNSRGPFFHAIKKKEGQRKPATSNALLTSPSQRIAYCPLPSYPWICRKRGHEGRVALKVKTNAQGHVLTVTLHKSSGHVRLDEAALEAVQSWRFTQGSLQKIISISFQLK